MNRYPKGQQTLNLIVKVARELFYEKGYSKTTIQEICDNANITLGNFTYYFKTKRELLRKIYADYIQNIEQFVLDNTDEYPDIFDKFLIHGFIYNYKIFSDDRISEFNRGIIENGSLFNDIFLYMDVNQFKFNYAEIFKTTSERDARLLYLADIGMRKEFTIYYLENKDLFESTLDFSLQMSRILCRIYKSDDELMRQKFANQQEFLERIRSCPVTLL